MAERDTDAFYGIDALPVLSSAAKSLARGRTAQALAR